MYELRLAMAFVGGAILAYGARLAGGCTSGHGISGALQLSVSSWIALACFTVIKLMLTAIIVGMLGLMAGSYFCAETSGHLASTIQKIGKRGGIMLPDVLGMRLAVLLAVSVPLLVLCLFVVANLAP